jgi:urease accessory protein
MPAPAMRTTVKAIRTILRDMTMHRTVIHRMIMASIITMITTTIITTSIATTTITATPMLMTTNKPPIGDRGSLSEAEAAALYRLMTFLSPAFPVGAFSYSSGIEWAVESGDIVDAASLRDWLSSMLSDGSGFCDGVFLAQAHRAVSSRDAAAFGGIAELAAAFVPSRERQLETSSQGRAFIEIARAAWNCDGLAPMIAHGEVLVYPIAVGLVSAAHKIPLASTMHVFLHALTSNWISAGSRLIPLGQTDSQRVLAGLEPVVAATAKRALEASLDDLGSANFRADLASLRHETQYTRLFRS